MTLAEVFSMFSVIFNLLTLAGLGVTVWLVARVAGLLRQGLRRPDDEVKLDLSKPNVEREPVDTRLNPPPAMKPLPLDTRLPPKVFTYNPRPGQTAPVCDCHSRSIKPGEQVVLWPVPCPPEENAGSRGYWIRCQEAGIKG